MKYIVYILYSQKDKKLYIGQTKNFDKRLHEHLMGYVKSTRNRRPLVVVQTEEYITRSEAIQREKFLKSLYGYKEKNKILKEFLSNGSSKF